MAAPDEWELVITSTSRIQLERALERLLHRDAALLRNTLDGEVPSVRSSSRCWRMGCLSSVEEGKIGCADHDVLDVEEDE